MTLTQLRALGALFAALHRIGAGGAAAERGFDLRPIQALPPPIESRHLVKRLQHLPIIVGGPSSFGMGRPRWDQGAHAFPQLITDLPRFRSAHVSRLPPLLL